MKKTITVTTALFIALMLSACGTPNGDRPSSAGDRYDPATDEQLSSLSWNGTAIEFTAIDEMTLTGISVFVNDTEYEGALVSNSEGNMGFSNGTRLTPGSVIGFHGGLIILAGTTASCEIDTGGATPDRVCFYLLGGEKVERKL